MDLRIDASDLAALAGRLNGAGGVVRQEVGAAMQRSTLAVQREAQVAAPVVTGHLRRSIASTATPEEGTVGTNVPYARAVHDGRGEVRPVRARVLRWVMPNGTVVFAMRSGPTKPNPFLRRALDSQRPAILREFRQIGPRVAKRIVGG